MSSYEPNDAINVTIDLPDNGEKANATNLNTGTKAVADRSEGLRKGLEYIATANSLLTSRGISDGIKRIRVFASQSDLSNLSVGAANDQEIALVAGGTIPVPYVYDHGNSSTADGVFVVNALSSTGRWIWLGNGLLAGNPGLPYTNSSGRLLGPTEIPKEVHDVEIHHAGTTLGDTAGDTEGTAIGATSSEQSSYSDVTSDGIYTISDIKDQDVLDISFSFLADCDGSTPDARGVVGLFAGQSGSFTELERTLVAATNAGGIIVNIRQYTLHGKYLATSNADVVIKLRVKTNQQDNAVCYVYKPCHCKVLQRRT